MDRGGEGKQRQREKGRGVRKEKIKHPGCAHYEGESICLADVNLKIPERKVKGQTVKEEEEISVQHFIKVCSLSIPTTTQKCTIKRRQKYNTVIHGLEKSTAGMNEW